MDTIEATEDESKDTKILSVLSEFMNKIDSRITGFENEMNEKRKAPIPSVQAYEEEEIWE